MKQLLKSLLLLMCMACSFQGRSQTPLAFNDKLTAITDSAYTLGKAWGSRFNEAYKTRDYASLRPFREKIERYIRDEIVVVEAMEDVKNSRALRMAMINFLRYEQVMIEKAFAPLERLDKHTPKSEVQAYLDQIRAYSTQEAEEMAKVYAAQESFAKANGFIIEDVKEENLDVR